jgi:hypothetical protein
MIESPRIYIALPILNESANINSLLDCLNSQNISELQVVACVNQYDDWWENNEKVLICEDNLKSIEFLENETNLNIHIIDSCTKGNGWPAKKGGVGWARKTIMDYIVSKANKYDIIVSIDADTYYPVDYIRQILNFFNSNKEVVGLSLPYYHRLNNDITDRLILRYEIYMRYYLLNMIRIENPYAFTALGSAMAFPVWAYNKTGGLTPVPAGEDFYFLQKLTKLGKIVTYSSSIAYPSPRFSDRVVFGTGPALIKGNDGDWMSYPHYHFNLFDEVRETYKLFGQLYTKDIPSPMDQFLKEQTKSENIWEPFRKNYRDQNNFINACITKVDGLRILQFLRKQQKTIHLTDEKIIYYFLATYHKNEIDSNLLSELKELDYENSPIKLLNKLRDFLFTKEMELRKLSL